MLHNLKVPLYLTWSASKERVDKEKKNNTYKTLKVVKVKFWMKAEKQDIHFKDMVKCQMVYGIYTSSKYE